MNLEKNLVILESLLSKTLHIPQKLTMTSVNIRELLCFSL